MQREVLELLVFLEVFVQPKNSRADGRVAEAERSGCKNVRYRGIDRVVIARIVNAYKYVLLLICGFDL